MNELTPERWLPVIGYEGLYEVGDWGRVRSLPRKGGNNRLYGGRVLKLIPANKLGHLKVHLFRNDQGKQCLVHVLVAEAFIGPCPKGLEVRHWDGNPTNNRLSNLLYGTHTENMRDLLRYGTHHNTAKTHCKNGHEYTPENTRIGSKGDRNCRECGRDQRYAAWKRLQARMQEDPDLLARERAKAAARARRLRAARRA